MVHAFTQIPEAFYQAEAFFLKDPQDDASGTLRQDPASPATRRSTPAGPEAVGPRLADPRVENILNKKYRSYGDRHDAPGTTFVAALTVDL